MMQKTVLGLTAAAATVIAVTGCRTYERTVVTPAPQPTVVTTAPAAPATVVTTTPAAPPTVVVATAAPPPLQQEVIPMSPGPDMVWIPGYWNWSNGQYNWVPGRYEAGRVGYQWVPQRWENINGQWTMTGGSWIRR
jgi:hypothetical protein